MKTIILYVNVFNLRHDLKTKKGQNYAMFKNTKYILHRENRLVPEKNGSKTVLLIHSPFLLPSFF